MVVLALLKGTGRLERVERRNVTGLRQAHADVFALRRERPSSRLTIDRSLCKQALQ